MLPPRGAPGGSAVKGGAGRSYIEDALEASILRLSRKFWYSEISARQMPFGSCGLDAGTQRLIQVVRACRTDMGWRIYQVAQSAEATSREMSQI